VCKVPSTTAEGVHEGVDRIHQLIVSVSGLVGRFVDPRPVIEATPSLQSKLAVFSHCRGHWTEAWSRTKCRHERIT
jgi:hypothetical protein